MQPCAPPLLGPEAGPGNKYWPSAIDALLEVRMPWTGAAENDLFSPSLESITHFERVIFRLPR